MTMDNDLSLGVMVKGGVYLSPGPWGSGCKLVNSSGRWLCRLANYLTSVGDEPEPAPILVLALALHRHRHLLLALQQDTGRSE